MKDIDQLLREMTLPEKAALLEGYQSWMTNAVPRLGIPSICLTDGPVGVRKKADGKGSGAIGLGRSLPSTVFPASVSIANSWNTDNAQRMGRAIGQECVGYDVQVLLGPALNLKRDPRCGRNFEYYSEDPLLSGRMAAAFTRGVQSTGTAACAKHFALNNNENYRYMCDALVDERAARELYLKGFEICVREGRPRAVMCAYNQVNGVHCSQNKWLLTQVLREEWGFDGLVMSDWGATVDRVKGVEAGLDLDMPGGVWDNRKAILQAVEQGALSTAALDRAVANVLRLVSDAQAAPAVHLDQQALLERNAELAVELAADCAVLLRNDALLPLSSGQRVLVVGQLFEKMRCQGAGSSGLNPARLISPRAAFDRSGTAYDYAQGYREMDPQPDEALERAAVEAAQEADVVLFFGGLTELYESEGYDRTDLSLPENQLRLLERLCSSGKRVAVVLFGGSPFELPFAEKTAAILHMFLPGQGGGEACRRLLFGEANPSGKLSETWVRTCADIPFGDQFGRHKVVPYRESIFVGYRYYDKAPDKIRYPFGFGLSYTSFSYGDLHLEHTDGIITAALTVTNTGRRDGAEVVQLYVGKNEKTAVYKAEKELRAFTKVYLKSGESKSVTLTFTEADLAYYHTALHRWVVENGHYSVLAGASSRDIRLTGSIEITGQEQVPPPCSAGTAAAYDAIAERGIPDSVFAQVLGRPIPQEPPALPYTIESPLSDLTNSPMGRFLYRCVHTVASALGRDIRRLPEGPEKEERIKNQRFLLDLIPSNSPRSLIQSGGGMAQMHMARAAIELANGHILRAVRLAVKREKPLPLPCEEQKS